MESITKSGKRAFFLGGLTLILFATRGFILDFIEPAKSLGRQVGETALDIFNTVKQNDKMEWPTTTREIWSNILIITSFVLLVATVYFSIESISKDNHKLYGIVGGVLGAIGLGMFLINVAASIIGILLILVLGAAIAVVLLGGS